ncbi:MAG TPA: NADPH-dependent F420 reductase [Acidimicrobiia bacterium]|nr:NADPH-dependent F420 reductase [Acidimicrobiia bacterium]
MQIGILGGTGPAGRALAARLADLGHDVVIGSRDAERARAVADDLQQRWGSRVATLSGAGNEVPAREGELVVLAVPWQAAKPVASELAEALAGKLVISMANALEKRNSDFAAVVPPDGSVAAGVAGILPDSRVVAALHHVPAKELGDLDQKVDGDVLVCADDREAAAAVVDLVETIPDLSAFDVGGLDNAVGIEAFTAVLLSLNVRYKTRSAIRLTGVTR